MSESKGSRRQRRQFSPEDKAAILRRHLVDHVPVSDLCDEYHIQPTLFYLWQRQALEHLSAALQDGRTTRGQQQATAAERARVAALEAKLAKKDAIIADIAAEPLALKKTWGELRQRWVPPSFHDWNVRLIGTHRVQLLASPSSRVPNVPICVSRCSRP